MMKDFFYFMLKLLFLYNIFQFLFWLFGHAGKGLNKKGRLNLKNHDVTDWETHCSGLIAQYLKKLRQKGNEAGSINRI